MEKEERNKWMEFFFSKCEGLTSWNEAQGKIIAFGRIEDYLPAIIETDRKARAWDELEKKVASRYGASQGVTACDMLWVSNTMSELIDPPKPKSKLERLRDFVDKGVAHPNFPNAVSKTRLLKEIDRLEAEDEE